MKNKGGISLKFDVASPTEVFATLQFFPTDTISQTTVEEDINLPDGVSITQGSACFKSGRILIMNRKCGLSPFQKSRASQACQLCGCL